MQPGTGGIELLAEARHLLGRVRRGVVGTVGVVLDGGGVAAGGLGLAFQPIGLGGGLGGGAVAAGRLGLGGGERLLGGVELLRGGGDCGAGLRELAVPLIVGASAPTGVFRRRGSAWWGSAWWGSDQQAGEVTEARGGGQLLGEAAPADLLAGVGIRGGREQRRCDRVRMDARRVAGILEQRDGLGGQVVHEAAAVLGGTTEVGTAGA